MNRKTGLLKELRRRNVFNVAIAYLISAWLLAQVADLVLGNFAAPPWAMRALLILLAIGFPLSLLISWLFKVTSKGVVHESEMDRTISITDQSGERLTRIIILILAIIIVFMGLERFVFSGHVSGPKRAPATENLPAPGNSESGNIGAPANPPDPFSVAFLPFTVMSTGPDDDYFAYVPTEEIINAPGQLPELMVTARTSVCWRSPGWTDHLGNPTNSR